METRYNRDNQPTPCNIPEERRLALHRGRNMSNQKL